MSFMISPEALKTKIGNDDLRIVDGSWHLPTEKRDAEAEYRDRHIEGAVFFDHDKIADLTTGLPHSIPSAKVFASAVGEMGISENDDIVVYDQTGLFSSARVWWLFRLFGAKNVSILAGGLETWAFDHPVTNAETIHSATTFNVQMDRGLVTSFDQMLAITSDQSRQIADARPYGRFTGEVPEPREGMRSGHMPNAYSLFFNSLTQHGDLLPEAELREVIQNAGIDIDKPVVTSCGSGVTAAVLSLALETLGHRDHTLYDGSWSEWGGRDDTPVETGGPALSSYMTEVSLQSGALNYLAKVTKRVFDE